MVFIAFFTTLFAVLRADFAAHKATLAAELAPNERTNDTAFAKLVTKPTIISVIPEEQVSPSEAHIPIPQLSKPILLQSL